MADNELDQGMKEKLEKLEVPDEVKKKFEKLKKELDSFKEKILKKFENYIIGLALLPPSKEEGQKEEKEKINVFVLVDDSDSKKMSKEELSGKLSEIIDKFAKGVDKNLEPQTMLLSELKEACFDGKYDVLKTIAVSAPLYDPKDMLAALRISEVHKSMAIKKFEKYVLSYVAAGSLFRGEKSNDIDVYIIIDDTDVKKMSRVELKDKLRAIITGMGMEASAITGVKKQFHVQTYILTDFWENLKEANPVIFTLLRDGVPLYDRGVFVPWKILLKSGKIKPSREAIDMNMEIGEKLIERTKYKMLSVVGEDLYYAILNPAQAAIMLYGLPPPTPKETIDLFDKVFVKKEKLLESKYVQILSNIRKYYKDIEHGKTKEMKGKDIDKLLEEATDFMERIKKLFGDIEERFGRKNINEVYNACVSAVRDAILMVYEKEENIREERLVDMFEEKLVDSGKLPKNLLETFKNIVRAKKEAEQGKLTKQELEKLGIEARSFIRMIVEFMQRIKNRDVERSKIRFKYGEKYGELLILGNKAFLTPDLEKKEEMQEADFDEEKGLSDVRESSPESMEKYLKSVKVPRQVFIKEKIFEDLKKLFGEQIKIFIGA